MFNKKQITELDERYNALVKRLDEYIHKVNYQNQQLRAEIEFLKQENTSLRQELNGLRDYYVTFN